ncbi:MAG: response regulator transcription factor, partial [Planctomycetota bacterium]
MNRPHVHIVDDDAAMRDTLQELCRDADLPCRCFADAESFLEQWCPEWRGCILLDYKLPGMDGLQLQNALPGHDCHLPVVFLTAHGDVPEAVRAIRDGAVDFLLKPFRAEELRQALDKALAQDRDREGLQARYAS